MLTVLLYVPCYAIYSVLFISHFPDLVDDLGKVDNVVLYNIDHYLEVFFFTDIIIRIISSY